MILNVMAEPCLKVNKRPHRCDPLCYCKDISKITKIERCELCGRCRTSLNFATKELSQIEGLQATSRHVN